MKLWHGFAFLLILALLPEVAHAFPNFIVNPGSCGSPESLVLSCNDNPEDGFFSSVACKTMKIYNKAIIPLYCNLVGSEQFLGFLTAALSLYIIFWAITYLFGLTTVTTGNAVARIIKFSFIFYLVTSQEIFFDVLYPFVLNIPEFLNGVIIQAMGNEEYTFYGHVDKSITTLFNGVFKPELEGSTRTGEKVDLRLFVLGMALWKAIPGGAFLGGMFFGVIVGWLAMYLSIMVRYLLALMTLIFLMMLSPLFITALLFDKTKYLGEEWIKMTSAFIIQIVTIVMLVLMVEDFFFEFFEYVKLGFNEILIEKNVGERVLDFGSLQKVQEEYGVSTASSEKYLVDSGIKDLAPEGEEFLPWFIVQMLIMGAIITLTKGALDFVPTFAGYLAGAPRFTSLMGRSKGDVQQAADLPFKDAANKFKRSLSGGGVRSGGNPVNARRTNNQKAATLQGDASSNIPDSIN